jgi:hypothetical protein
MVQRVLWARDVRKEIDPEPKKSRGLSTRRFGTNAVEAT